MGPALPSNEVFINCPFDREYEPLLQAMLFCVVYLGYRPRLANERMDGGENRLDKIMAMIGSSAFSIHDLSRCKASVAGEAFRMNMPFEFGIDTGLRRMRNPSAPTKRFLVFEEKQYELKKSLSDVAGQDVEHHDGNFELIIEKVRNFLGRTASGATAPGPTQIVNGYITFQAWLAEKKIAEGHSEKQALNIPTSEMLDEMTIWRDQGKPSRFPR